MRAGEIGELTQGERLLIDRRRRGESQPEAARRLGISQPTYKRWEAGQRSKKIRLRIGELADHERCLIYRRRAGFQQRVIAAELGVCRWMIYNMESGKRPCDLLLWYWEQ